MNWSREDCQKWLPLVQAVAEGKTVELCVGEYSGNLEYIDCVFVNFNEETGERTYNGYLPVTFPNDSVINPNNIRISKEN